MPRSARSSLRTGAAACRTFTSIAASSTTGGIARTATSTARRSASIKLTKDWNSVYRQTHRSGAGRRWPGGDAALLESGSRRVVKRHGHEGAAVLPPLDHHGRAVGAEARYRADWALGRKAAYVG